MITVITNIKDVAQKVLLNLRKVGDQDKTLRTCATSVLDLMKKRVHRDGIASDGSQIGTYSAAYMKVRTGNYGNSKRKKDGTLKDAGVFKSGAARPKYNRSSDTKVVASLTRQMENDLKVIPLTDGYGIGFINSHNLDKARWVEQTYNKKIFQMAQAEKDAVQDIITDAISQGNS